ncbi:MAG: YggS family pyridoxal phosphate-dependent enzyme [bacterium]|nr:YggS family pyridoxal phosphate-dependent enzyme [bacterium]
MARVEERIASALSVAGRRREEITLVAVTKVFPAAAILDGYKAGLRCFGESYVQEFAAKQAEVAHLEGARIHLIGHLQSNKARPAAELFDVIQSVDTPKLARRLNEHARGLEVMIEVKLSPEEAKRGANPSDLPALVEAIRGHENLKLVGLMTMPPWSEDPEPSRPYFARLRELAGRFCIENLSMGMSHDFEVAIAEGATHIRVGTALFGPRRKR